MYENKVLRVREPAFEEEDYDFLDEDDEE